MTGCRLLLLITHFTCICLKFFLILSSNQHLCVRNAKGNYSIELDKRVQDRTNITVHSTAAINTQCLLYVCLSTSVVAGCLGRCRHSVRESWRARENEKWIHAVMTARDMWYWPLWPPTNRSRCSAGPLELSLCADHSLVGWTVRRQTCCQAFRSRTAGNVLQMKVVIESR